MFRTVPNHFGRQYETFERFHTKLQLFVIDSGHFFEFFRVVRTEPKMVPRIETISKPFQVPCYVRNLFRFGACTFFFRVPFSKLDDGQSVLSDKKEVVDTLFSYYENQFEKTIIKTDDSNDMRIEEKHGILLKELSISEETIELTSAFEITKFVKKLKPKKSSGFDQISNFMIKMLPSSYITCLVNCFNVWLNEGRYLEQWKLAIIVTLNKLKADVTRCDQTRPISLLATPFEKVILEKARYWAERNQLIPSEQSGFRPGCLLPTRVLSIYQEVDNNRVANIPTLAIYVDY